MQGSRKMTELARRFVGGDTVEESCKRAEFLFKQGKRSSLFYLGEYVQETAELEKTMRNLESVIRQLKQQGLDIHISVDPTQIGLMNSKADFQENALSLARLIQEQASSDSGCHLLMIDMEDASVTDQTLEVYHFLHDRQLPCAVTLQAYLHRTANDLEQIIAKGGKVRLVKGAFAEPESIAYTSRKETNASYFFLAQKMLSPQAKVSSFYPIFGTHDEEMIEKIITYGDEMGWKRDAYEFEFLLGVRDVLQDKLVGRGCRLRLYVPFGTEWWAYSVRRVGENPRNGLFLLRSLCYR